MVPTASSPAEPLVLIVENDPHLGDALRLVLELEGRRVQVWPTAADLLERPAPEGLACLVLDEDLPDMNGLDALRALRARGVDLPAILLISRPRSRLRKSAHEAKAELVEKPLLDDALLSAIRRALDDVVR